MSFQDLETGLTQPARAVAPASPQDAAFLQLNSSLSMTVFKINSNVQGISKLIDQLGTLRDTGPLRKNLHDLTEVTRELVKRGTEDLKQLTALQASLPARKTALAKTMQDFKVACSALQRTLQRSAERQRTVVEGVKLAVDDDVPLQDTSGVASPEQRQAQMLQQQMSPMELQHQETLIREGEAEIRQIESGIQEVHEMFRDLATIVGEQGHMIDNIESNIQSVAVDTHEAARELTTASDYQRRAGRRAACLGIVIIIVTAVVLLAILS